MARDPFPEEQQLEVLIGRWRTRGSTIAGEGEPALEIDATDTYEWLPGRFGLLHEVDARVGDERVEGAELIGWDPERGTYVTQYFGSDGPNAYEATLAEEDDRLLCRMVSGSDRFEGVFSADRRRIDGHWERRTEGGWEPWMKISLTRED